MTVRGLTSETTRSGITWHATRLISGAILCGFCAVLAASWNFGRSESAPEPLTLNLPYDIALHAGQATVDLYLEADIPVRLLVSNLGSTNRNAILHARCERLQGPAQSPPARWRPNSSGPGESPSISGFRVASPPEPSSAASAPPATRDFWLHVTETPLEDPRGYQLVHGRLASFQDTVEVYTDASLDSPSGRTEQTEELAKEIAHRLARDVLPTIHRHVGPIADPDLNGRLTVLVTPWLGRLRGGTTQVRGFVRSSDLRTDLAAPFSNHADLLYLNSELPAGEALLSLLLHEVTHTALASRQTRLRDERLPDWDDWLNEGLAHLIERQGREDWSNLDYRVAQYWQRPESAPLAVRDYYRTGRWRNHGCRGATFLFLNWCQQQALAIGIDDFIPRLVATGKTNQEAIELLLHTPFADLYRSWTLSLTNERDDPRAANVGRFLNSGVRFRQWQVAKHTTQAYEVSGTATRFMELCTSKTGWYRVIFTGDALDDWQLTIIRTSQRTPEISLHAQWSRETDSEPAQLIVQTAAPLATDWRAAEVSCELIHEPRVRVWNWGADKLMRKQESGTWRVPLSQTELTGTPALLKVRFVSDSGGSTWGWVDVPPGPNLKQLASGAPAVPNSGVQR